MKVTTQVSGSFNNTEKWVKSMSNLSVTDLLTETGSKIVDGLRGAAPVRTGKLRSSFDYNVSKNELEIINTDTNDGKSLVSMIVNGHGTRTGGYVPPNDFVKPVVTPVLNDLNSKIERRLK